MVTSSLWICFSLSSAKAVTATDEAPFLALAEVLPSSFRVEEETDLLCLDEVG